jgi:hypothetical protein
MRETDQDRHLDLCRGRHQSSDLELDQDDRQCSNSLMREKRGHADLLCRKYHDVVAALLWCVVPAGEKQQEDATCLRA